LKGRIQAGYAKELAHQKSELKRAGDIELDRLRSQLAMAGVERNTLFNALTTRLFDAIAEIHAALLKFHIALGRLTASTRAAGVYEQALFKNVADASEVFDKVLTDKQIFLSQPTEAKVAEIRQMLVSNANLFQWTVAMNQHDIDRPQKWMEIEQAVRGPSRMRSAISRQSCGY